MKIQKAYLHVDVNGTESDGLALQRNLPGLCRDWLLPALERIVNRYAPQEGTLCIERLEIDAGAISLDRLEHDLAESAAQAMEKALREQQLSSDEPAAAEQRSGGKTRYKTRRHSIEEAFVFFLETGQLPWSFRLPEGRSLEQVVLDSWQVTEQSSGSQGAEQVRRVLASASVRKRLTRQFTPTLHKALLTRLAPAGVAIMEKMLQVLGSGKVPPAERRQIERLLWESALSRVAAGQPVTVAAIIRDVLPTALGKQRAAVEVLARYWSLESESYTQSETKPSTVAQERLGKALQSSDPFGHSPVKRTTGEPSSDINNVPFRQERGDAVQEQAVEAFLSSPLASSEQMPTEQGLADTLAEAIYINNAGLVLLHPFLPQFFGALDIAEENQLLQPERALCLLHFLATGQRIAPEYELMLPKILCNIRLDMPVEADVALTDEEQGEAEALLKAVIGHWLALRNTSPDGLRGTFIVRPGKISQRDDDWLLQVETQTWDILLDQLPWGIGMIKLPWMERMLWVEWA